MEDPSTPEFPNISPSISRESMMETCKTLSRVIQPEDENDYILHHLWRNVYDLLEVDIKLKPAPEDEFLENVKSSSDGNFIGKVRDLAATGPESVNRWGSLFSDGTYFILFSACCADNFQYLDVFYSRREVQTLYSTESSVRGA